MKKLLIAATVAASCFAPQAFAQANDFAGFSVAANVNTATAATKISGNGQSGQSFSLGESSANASLQAAYGLTFSSNFVLGFGGTVALGDLKAGSLNYGQGSAFAIKATDMYSVYIEPGYPVSNSTLVYAKLAYLTMKGEFSSPNSSNMSQDFDGIGYSVGIRAKLSKNIFLQAEFAQSDYNEVTKLGAAYKPSTTTGTVGLGYQF